MVSACARAPEDQAGDEAAAISPSGDTVPDAAAPEPAVTLPGREGRLRPAPEETRWRSRVEILDADLALGPRDAPVTLLAILRLPSPGDDAAPALHAFVRLVGRATRDGFRVVFRPRLLDGDAVGTRLARLFLALPDDDARLRWLAEMLGGHRDAWYSAMRFATREVLTAKGDAPATDAALIEALREQVRLRIRENDVIFVNGRRLDPAPGESDVVFAARTEERRLRDLEGTGAEEAAGPLGGFLRADEIGPRTLPVRLPRAPDDPLDLVAFVDFRDPHSKRVAARLVRFLEESPLAHRVAPRLASFALDTHPGALQAGALARCAAGQVGPARVLEGLFGIAYLLPGMDPDTVCAALDLPVATCVYVKGCAALRCTADAVLADRAEARAAGAFAPPAVFLDGRQVAPRHRAFSTLFLEDVLLGYHLRAWTLPTESRLAPQGRTP